MSEYKRVSVGSVGGRVIISNNIIISLLRPNGFGVFGGLGRVSTLNAKRTKDAILV